MRGCPCYHCPNRQVGCHNECIEYKHFREAIDLFHRKQVPIRDADSARRIAIWRMKYPYRNDMKK